MNFGADGTIVEAGVVLNQPFFVFREFIEDASSSTNKNVSNIWFNGETMNEKYSIDESLYMFEYNGKVGFVAKKEGKSSIYFNGKEMTNKFDEIRTEGCCSVVPYPIRISEDGELLALARNGKEYYFVEVDLKNE